MVHGPARQRRFDHRRRLGLVPDPAPRSMPPASRTAARPAAPSSLAPVSRIAEQAWAERVRRRLEQHVDRRPRVSGPARRPTARWSVPRRSADDSRAARSTPCRRSIGSLSTASRTGTRALRAEDVRPAGWAARAAGAARRTPARAGRPAAPAAAPTAPRRRRRRCRSRRRQCDRRTAAAGHPRPASGRCDPRRATLVERRRRRRTSAAISFDADAEEAAPAQRLVEQADGAVLQLALEVDQHVAARHQLDFGEHAVGGQAVVGEDDAAACRPCRARPAP